MAHYSSQIYWDRRYSTHRGATFDWYLPYKIAGSNSDLLREELVSTIRRGSRILVLGCGTSTLAEGLYDDGYTNIVAVDFSSPAIEVMAERSGVSHSMQGSATQSHAGGAASSALPKEPLPEADVRQRPGLVYTVANATELPAIFQAASFDVVLDKGMLDACFCGDSDAQQRKYAAHIVKNIHIVLKVGKGRLIHISHTNKTLGMRSVLFDDESTPWSDVNVTKLVSDPTGGGTTGDEQEAAEAATSQAGSEFLVRSHYMYVMTKGTTSGGAEAKVVG